MPKPGERKLQILQTLAEMLENPKGEKITTAALAAKLQAAGATDPRFNDYLLRTTIGDCALTLFADGRAIVQGTGSPDHARTIYTRYIGL